MTNDAYESEYARYAASSKGAIELAAAAATAEVSRLFQQVIGLSKRKQRDVADAIGVSESRVSQVLNGDGNVNVAALAKYARAYGYQVRFVLTPIDAGVQALPEVGRRRARRRPDRGAGRPLELHVNTHAQANEFVVTNGRPSREWSVVRPRYAP